MGAGRRRIPVISEPGCGLRAGRAGAGPGSPSAVRRPPWCRRSPATTTVLSACRPHDPARRRALNSSLVGAAGTGGRRSRSGLVRALLGRLMTVVAVGFGSGGRLQPGAERQTRWQTRPQGCHICHSPEKPAHRTPAVRSIDGPTSRGQPSSGSGRRRRRLSAVLPNPSRRCRPIWPATVAEFVIPAASRPPRQRPCRGAAAAAAAFPEAPAIGTISG